ncbi:Pentatricopeptide repeat-containing protein [Acorus calamus]|uniref:Pentatricopeptide repeat-containing protein n=1 Tax=Acorus calamus TaxID=4465 RepID=A0AAV9FAR5_ACOCL|nr:Pentatricopeptide repeat-containing protein [Acorus calamus]
MPDPDLRSWTALITTYAKRGLPRESVRLYDELRKKRIEPDKFVLLSAAKACAASVDLAKARDVHKDAVEYGFGSDLVLGNALIDMYGKCGSHEEARRVFGELAERDVISWTSLVAAYLNSGLPSDAFRVLRDMGSKGAKPNSVTLSTILPACSNLRALNLGREIHGFAMRNGFSENVFVSSGLVDIVYSVLAFAMALPTTARRMFTIPLPKMPLRSLSTSPHPQPSDQSPPSPDPLISTAVSVLRDHRSKSRWNHLKSLLRPIPSAASAMTSDQVSQIVLRLKNNPRLALRFFLWSKTHSLVSPSLASHAVVAHVLARNRLKSLAKSLIRSALRSDEDAPLSLLDELARSYRLCDSAPFVFDLLVEACLDSRRADRALEVARSLRSRGVSPSTAVCNHLIRSVAAGAGGSLAAVALYREFFDPQIASRVSPNTQTFNSILLSLYSILMAAACDERRIGEAEKLFEEMTAKGVKRGVMAYNTIIGGFSAIGDMDRAEELRREMVMSGVEPTRVTYERLIDGLCKAGDVDSAVRLYNDVRGAGVEMEGFVADELVVELCERGRVLEGLGIVRRERFVPSRRCYLRVVKGLCECGEVEAALKVQAEMVGRGYGPDEEVYEAFVDGYARLGDVERVRKLKDEMSRIDEDNVEGSTFYKR